MDVRKNAVDLSDDEQQAVVEAFIKLKARQAPGAPAGTSVYDQFVALHGAVMAVLSPGVADPINFAHGNVGFLPWHRQYLRVLELALQQEVAGVTLPYWRWSDDVSAATRLFTPDFLSYDQLGRADCRFQRRPSSAGAGRGAPGVVAGGRARLPRTFAARGRQRNGLVAGKHGNELAARHHQHRFLG